MNFEVVWRPEDFGQLADIRYAFDPPLAVVYHVHPADRLAVVVSYGLSRRPRPPRP